MKKILALVSFLSLLVFAAACTTEPTSKTSSNANTSTIKAAAPSEADMIAKETAAWETLKKRDVTAFGGLLTSDYIEVTAENVYDKTSILADVQDFNLTDAKFSDWKMMPIDNDAVILTYQTTLKGSYKGADVPPGPYRSAAVWVNRDGKWSAIYFQQTPVTTMQPPPPAASASKPEKAAPASPAAKPAETGPDPIANEKIVWDLFRSKNVDGFAALLDSTFVEIETNAVYDKATAVKSVGDYDFSQFELSEWKATKIDNDAALVTYLLKSKDPKMNPERHTTIWANRNGKWVAILHVGTPVAKPAAKPESKKV